MVRRIIHHLKAPQSFREIVSDVVLLSFLAQILCARKRKRFLAALEMTMRRKPRETLIKETLIKSLSDFTLEFLCTARNHLTRIASYVRKVMPKLCIKILVKSVSAIESAFP